MQLCVCVSVYVCAHSKILEAEPSEKTNRFKRPAGNAFTKLMFLVHVPVDLITFTMLSNTSEENQIKLHGTAPVRASFSQCSAVRYCYLDDVIVDTLYLHLLFWVLLLVMDYFYNSVWLKLI